MTTGLYLVDACFFNTKSKSSSIWLFFDGGPLLAYWHLLFVSKRKRCFWNTKSKSFSTWLVLRAGLGVRLKLMDLGIQKDVQYLPKEHLMTYTGNKWRAQEINDMYTTIKKKDFHSDPTPPGIRIVFCLVLTFFSYWTRSYCTHIYYWTCSYCTNISYWTRSSWTHLSYRTRSYCTDKSCCSNLTFFLPL
jgi:hypothetical protein